jgi:hypothetical protein
MPQLSTKEFLGLHSGLIVETVVQGYETKENGILGHESC